MRGEAVLVALLSVSAAAEDARALFQRGSKQLEAGDARAAAASFDAAYAAQRAPSLLYWRGEARFRLGEKERAAELFGKYLAKLPKGPKAKDARARLDEIKTGRKRSKIVVEEMDLGPKRMVVEEMKLEPPKASKPARRSAKAQPPP